MNATICGVDDRILYVVICWAAIAIICRVYDLWTSMQLKETLKSEAKRVADSRTAVDNMVTK